MKNLRFFLVLFCAGLIIANIIIACKKDDDVPQDERTAILAFLQKAQNAKHDYLIGRGSRADVGQFYEDDGAEILNKIDYFKSESLKIQDWYTAYTSQVTVDSIVNTMDGYIVNFSDRTALTTNTPDSDSPGKFVVSEGGDVYKVYLKKIGGTLLISKEVPLDTEIAPPYYINPNNSVGTDTISVIDNIIASDRSYNYNATAAKNYAYQHVNSPNLQFCNFYYGGGDCTNFLSQCLWAGGWTMNPNNWWATMGGSCCDNPYGCGIPTCYHCNWTVANKFYNYLLVSGRIFPVCYVDNALNVGDIIELASNGSVYHNTLVTKKEIVNGVTKVYVTFRTANPGLNKKDYLSTNMGGTHYG